MAKKSKTQRAKASEKRASKKNAATGAHAQVEAIQDPAAEKRAAKAAAAAEKQKAKAAKKVNKKPSFLSEVRAELKRVTWPTKQDVLRWSAVVVVALIFFGVYVLVLDNLIWTPVLLAISELGVGV